MSPIVRFPNGQAVRNLLKFIQPIVSDEWGPDDRFHVAWPRRARRGDDESSAPRVFLDLTHPKLTKRDLERWQRIVGFEFVEQLPGGARCYEPAKFLELIRLQRDARRHVRPRDLLVALYDVGYEALADVFGSAPKSPYEEAKVVFLADPKEGPARTPRMLVFLPQADPSFDWPIWLESKCRRYSSADRKEIKLFYRLPGGTRADFFIEYGWVHPLPLIRELYSNPHNARLILIPGEERGGRREGQESRPRVVWQHILATSTVSEYSVGSSPEDVFNIHLAREQLASEAEVSAPPERELRLVPELQPLSPDRKVLSDRLDHRIQHTKDLLYHLEANRAGLLEREKVRFRFVLRFAQKRGRPGTVRRLANHFQRFLLLSWGRRDRFHYVFQETPEGGDAPQDENAPETKDKVVGYHVLLTRDAVFYHDLHLGLADEVYYHPEYWDPWRLEVFVRSDCEFLPRVEDRGTALLLRNALDHIVEVAGFGEADDRCLLLHPAEASMETPFAVTAVRVGRDRHMGQLLAFVNTEFPVAELRARAQAKGEFEDALKQRARGLERRIEQTELTLKREMDRRLLDARKLWNETAPAIEKVHQVLTVVAARFEVLREMLGDFAGGWQAFVEHILDVNQRLIQDKLDELRRLEESERDWAQTLANIEQAARDVREELPALRRHFEQRLEEAEKWYELVRRAYEETRELADRAEKGIRDAVEEVGGLIREARQRQGTLQGKERDLDNRVSAAQDVVKGLEECTERIVEWCARFEDMVSRIQRMTESLVEGIERLGGLETAVQQARDAWREQEGEAKRRLAQVRGAFGSAEEEIRGLLTSIQASLEEARALAVAIRERREEQERRLKELADEVEKAEKDCRELEDILKGVRKQEEILEKHRDLLDETKDRLSRARDDRDAAEAEFRKAARDLALEAGEISDERFREVAEEMKEVARDLGTLADLELEVGSLKRLGSVARVQAIPVKALKKARIASEEARRRIWES